MANGKKGAPYGNKNARGGLIVGLVATGQENRRLFGATYGAGGNKIQQDRFKTATAIRGGISGGLTGAIAGGVVGAIAGGGVGSLAGAALGSTLGAGLNSIVRKQEAKNSIEYGKRLKAALPAGDIAGLSNNLKAYSQLPKTKDTSMMLAMSVSNARSKRIK